MCLRRIVTDTEKQSLVVAGRHCMAHAANLKVRGGKANESGGLRPLSPLIVALKLPASQKSRGHGHNAPPSGGVGPALAAFSWLRLLSHLLF